MRTESELRAFCRELSSAEPSPGGGTAAAAAGGMAASLIAMACGLTAKSNKHASDKRELDDIVERMSGLREELIGLGAEDSRAYDQVVVESRKLRSSGLGEATDGYENALKRAAEVPLKTAEACGMALEAAARASEIALRSTRSDIGVAALLAKAGLNGAYMNVIINLESISDQDFAKLMRRRLDELLARGDSLSRQVLKKVSLQ